jgi:hypothetical protein
MKRTAIRISRSLQKGNAPRTLAGWITTVAQLRVHSESAPSDVEALATMLLSTAQMRAAQALDLLDRLTATPALAGLLGSILELQLQEDTFECVDTFWTLACKEASGAVENVQNGRGAYWRILRNIWEGKNETGLSILLRFVSETETGRRLSDLGHPVPSVNADPSLFASYLADLQRSAGELGADWDLRGIAVGA